MTEPANERVLRVLPPDEQPAGWGDAIPLLERIAESLEVRNGKSKRCDGSKGDATCALDPSHVGYHVSADGRLHWLDEE